MSGRLLLVALVGASLFVAGCGGGGESVGGVEARFRSTGTALPYYEGAVTVAGDLVYYLVSEFDQAGTDLNGDLDLSDNVVHVLDPVTGTVTNTGRAGAGLPRFTAGSVVWAVPEASEAATDFNGDGDFADEVLAVFDPSQPVSPTNPRVTPTTVTQGSALLCDGDFVAFIVHEGDDGIERTGNGLLDEFAVEIFNVQTDAVASAGMAFDIDAASLEVGNGIVVYVTPEGAAGIGGTDLNGDGDMTDRVVVGVVSATGATFMVGGPPRAVVSTIGIAGSEVQPMIAYLIDETAEGQSNFNGGFGDGDANDVIVALWDVVSGTEFLPLGGVAAASPEMSGNTDRFVFLASEADNGFGTDLNGDGDVTDAVPFWVDLAAPGVAHSLGLASLSSGSLIQACDFYLLFLVSESDQGSGGTNFNAGAGDIDTDDQVTFFADLRAPAIPAVSTGFATNELVCFPGENFFFLTADESKHGGFDVNADGDSSDIVPVYFRVEPTTGQISQGGHPIRTDGPLAFQVAGNTIRIWANAKEDNVLTDLNDDGDLDDYGILVTEINRSNGGIYGYEAISGSDEEGTFFPTVVNDRVVVFPVSESTVGAGTNLNGISGDTDAFDLVLVYVLSQ